MIRKKIYPVDEILKNTIFIPKTNRVSKEGKRILSGRDCKVLIDDELINMASDRYKIFYLNRRCVCCGLEGAFMAMEKGEKDVSYHFNMYAIVNGKEILFTKDHIIPKSKGGKNHISNYQTMCVRCNNHKGDKQ